MSKMRLNWGRELPCWNHKYRAEKRGQVRQKTGVHGGALSRRVSNRKENGNTREHDARLEMEMEITRSRI